ncbi:hypothetical protein FB45DRAFT_1130807 [Roridomyces roridus]|uniref:Uncharacterized protein n=1 Tax=Roridomyces roridus TaxID=1738132 RepID=A0AAD7B2Q2_9AGAR|nr:hypothetical protein FB45DRAFT_1130807 [Roridomyces roridus]
MVDGRAYIHRRVSQTSLFAGGIHVQKLSTKYTLVNHRCNPRSFFIGPLRGVPDSVYSAFLACPDLQYADVTVESRSNVIFTDLVAFIARQEDLRALNCSPNSIRRSSLVSGSPSQHHSSSKIKELIAPASYIPHLLPLTPHVEWLSLSFPSLPRKLPVPAISICRGSLTMPPTPWLSMPSPVCRRGRKFLSLGFIFDLTTTTNLAWQMDGESDRPERHLHRVVAPPSPCDPDSLRMCDTYTPLPWSAVRLRLRLGSEISPSLRSVSFDRGTVELISSAQRLVVVEDILAGVSADDGCWDVVFGDD